MPALSEVGEIADCGRALRIEYGLTGRLHAEDRLHVTLQWLGDFLGLLPEAVAVARAMAGCLSMPPFLVEFDSVTSFGRAVVLTGGEGTAGLHFAQQAMAEQMRAAGFDRLIDPDFRPHMTLLYDDRHLDNQPISPIRWWVREFVLVHSLLGRTHYNFLARFPLR
jgi:2'-5' RNA ligase